MITREQFNEVFERMVVYASEPRDAEDVLAPSPEEQLMGMEPIETLPAQWYNWFLQEATKRFNGVLDLVGNMVSEIDNLLSLCGVSADKESITQLKEMFGGAYPDKILKNLRDSVSEIEGIIPENTDENNKLTNEGFVLRHIATNTANFRGEWPDWSSVPSDGEKYPVDYIGNHNPTENDYMVVRDMSDYSPTVETVIGPIAEVKLQEDGTLFDPYTTYGSVETPAGVNEVRVWTTDGAAKFKYYVDGFGGPDELKEVSGSFESPGVIEIDPSKAHMIVLMIRPSDWEAGNTLYSQTVSSSSPVYKGAWQFKYTGNWEERGKDGWEPEFSLGSLVDYDELNKHYAKGSSSTLDLPNATIDKDGNTAIGGDVTVRGRLLRLCEIDVENHALILW